MRATDVRDAEIPILKILLKADTPNASVAEPDITRKLFTKIKFVVFNILAAGAHVADIPVVVTKFLIFITLIPIKKAKLLKLTDFGLGKS